MSSSLAIESNNAIRHIIDQAYPKNQFLSNTEFNQTGNTKPSSEISAVSTTLSQDYVGSSIIDRGNIFSMATGGLASMSATSTTPPFDTYNHGAFLVTQTTRANKAALMRVF